MDILTLFLLIASAGAGLFIGYVIGSDANDKRKADDIKHGFMMYKGKHYRIKVMFDGKNIFDIDDDDNLPFYPSA